jgi:hypothetical protein
MGRWRVREYFWDLGFCREVLALVYATVWHVLYVLILGMEAWGVWKFYGLCGMDTLHKLIGPGGLHLIA